MMNMIIYYLIRIIDIFCSGSIANQDDAALSHISDLIAFYPVLACIKIKSYCIAAAVTKSAVAYCATFGAPESKKAVWLINHLPVMLYSDIIFYPKIPIGM